MSVKNATPESPIHELVAKRWSPYGFDPDRSISPDDLKSLFEAARWAPSSYNEQPWRFLVAFRSEAADFAKVLSCFVEANQQWAKWASVLMLTVVSEKFERNGKPNKAAEHDLGLAMGNLSMEASARGIAVHQMIGIDPDKAKSSFAIPNDFHAFTGVALGFPGAPEELDSSILQRDNAPRTRRKVEEFVFSGHWSARARWL